MAGNSLWLPKLLGLCLLNCPLWVDQVLLMKWKWVKANFCFFLMKDQYIVKKYNSSNYRSVSVLLPSNTKNNTGQLSSLAHLLLPQETRGEEKHTCCYAVNAFQSNNANNPRGVPDTLVGDLFVTLLMCCATVCIKCAIFSNKPVTSEIFRIFSICSLVLKLSACQN